MKIRIYHGSKNRIEAPRFGEGKPYNDYGPAFYCTEDMELACEWAVNRCQDGYVNQYELDMDGLRVLNLNDKKYCILNWLAILLRNRIFDVETGMEEEAKEYILEHFLIDYSRYDVIIGYRADDSYFAFAEDFLNNMISVNTLARAMYLGKLGSQIAICSKKAFERLEFVGAEEVSAVKWFPKKERRDVAARITYKEIRKEKHVKGELYVINIMDEGVTADDVRLRPDLTKES